MKTMADVRIVEDELKGKALERFKQMREQGRSMVYLNSQGQVRDREILERYDIIITYFENDPERARTLINHPKLRNLYFHDWILAQNPHIRKRLEKIQD